MLPKKTIELRFDFQFRENRVNGDVVKTPFSTIRLIDGPCSPHRHVETVCKYIYDEYYVS